MTIITITVILIITITNDRRKSKKKTDDANKRGAQPRGLLVFGT